MIYMDNAATTGMRPEVVSAMLSYMNNRYGNPSGIYEFSKSVRQDIERARAVVADTINALPEEIYFTSGGTESDNWALKMCADEYGRGHMITSKIEHHAILNSCRYLEEHGYEVSYLDVDSDGFVDIRNIENNIRHDTFLVSVMAGNNEIGTIEPVRDIGRLTAEYGILFHTDAVQAYTNIPIDVKRMGVNMMSVSGHKINGPKGVGFLYIEKDCLKTAFVNGGAQEMGLRAGTENVAGIMGLCKAAEIAVSNMQNRITYEIGMRKYMTSRIMKEIPRVRLNGSERNRLPNNMNFSFEGVDGASLILLLDKGGICASAGSACSSSQEGASHVLKAIGLSDELAHSTVRFTINEHITRREIDYTVDYLKHCVSKLRMD